MALATGKTGKAAQSAPKRASLAPSTFVAGGLFDDIDMTIIDTSFAEWDYNGAIKQPVLALAVQFEDENGKTYDQYLSAGDLIYFVPSDDGSYAVPVGDKAALNDNTNMAKFLASMVDCGFPEDTLAEGDIKCIVGTKVHVNRVAAPKRQGLIRSGKNAEREQTILVVTKIHSLPGEDAGKGKTAKPAAGTAKQAMGGKVNGAAKTSKAGGKADEDVAVTELAQSTLLSILGENGEVEKRKLAGLVFKALAGEALKNKVVAYLSMDANISQIEGVEYDGGILKLAE